MREQERERGGREKRGNKSDGSREGKVRAPVSGEYAAVTADRISALTLDALSVLFCLTIDFSGWASVRLRCCETGCRSGGGDERVVALCAQTQSSLFFFPFNLSITFKNYFYLHPFQTVSSCSPSLMQHRVNIRLE